MELFIDAAYAQARKYAHRISVGFISLIICILIIITLRLYIRHDALLDTTYQAQQEVAQFADAPARLKRAQEMTDELLQREQKFHEHFSVRHHALITLLTLLSERMPDDVIITELTFDAKQFHLLGTASHMQSVNELVRMMQNADLFSSVEMVSLERLIQPSTSLVFTIVLSES